MGNKIHLMATLTRIVNAEKIIRKYGRYYHAPLEDYPAEFKLILTINNFKNPPHAFMELLKIVQENEKIFIKDGKESGINLKKYKRKSRELAMFINSCMTNPYVKM